MELNLVDQLNLSNAFLKNLQSNYLMYYRKTIRNKMKFGQPQIDQKGDTKTRITYEPCGFLKDKQRQVNALIQEQALPSSMFGGIPGLNSILHSFQHINGQYFLTIDLKDFFGRIGNKQVNQALRFYGFSQSDARLITMLTTFKGSLPQGAPSSSSLANLVFAETAQTLENLCRNKDIIFTNFVDDLTFSSKKDFKYLISQILDILKNAGFYAHPDKIHYRRNSCEITGLTVNHGQLHLCKSMLARIDNAGVKAYADEVEKYNAIAKASRSIN